MQPSPLLPSSASVFRFAPSPNGRLHLGHALSALIGFEMARQTGGRFLLRIEDIDQDRSKPELIEAIYDDLHWLGIVWETPVRVQSQHFDDYRAAAAKLLDLGVLYECVATRGEIAAAADPSLRDPDGGLLYPGRDKVVSDVETEHRVAQGEPYALRLDSHRALALASSKLGGNPLIFHEMIPDGTVRPQPANAKQWGDAVIVRKETPASYHLAVVVDDALQGVTHVTRGFDLFPATGVHRLLQVLLDLDAPVYMHHRLLTDAAGRKLSKSASDVSLASLRLQGWSARDVGRRIGL